MELLSALFSKLTGAPREANEFEGGLRTVTPRQLPKEQLVNRDCIRTTAFSCGFYNGQSVGCHLDMDSQEMWNEGFLEAQIVEIVRNLLLVL